MITTSDFYEGTLTARQQTHSPSRQLVLPLALNMLATSIQPKFA